MEGSVATAGKLTPPGSTTRAANSGDGSKQQTIPEVKSRTWSQPPAQFKQMEPAPACKALSPLKKKIKPAGSTDVFETVTAGASKEISLVFSEFARVLNDQAAGDTSRMKELEGILAEARDLESYLKEKKQHLRQMLAVISDKLQG